MKSKNTKDTVVAVEKFIPELRLEYRERFKGIIKKLGKSLPINRYEIFNEELCTVSFGRDPKTHERYELFFLRKSSAMVRKSAGRDS